MMGERECGEREGEGGREGERESEREREREKRQTGQFWETAVTLHRHDYHCFHKHFICRRCGYKNTLLTFNVASPFVFIIINPLANRAGPRSRGGQLAE